MVISWSKLVVDNELNAELFEEIILAILNADENSPVYLINITPTSYFRLFRLDGIPELLAVLDKYNVQIPFDIKLKYF